MDPTDTAISSQCALLGQHDQMIRALFENTAAYDVPASSRLLGLRQGSRSVADYWTLAAKARWNDEVLQGVFRGLNEQLKDELAARDPPSDLQSLVLLSSGWITGSMNGVRNGQHRPSRLRLPAFLGSHSSPLPPLLLH